MTFVHETQPFNFRYIIREPAGIRGDITRASHLTASCNYLSISRQNGEDEFGPTPDFASRDPRGAQRNKSRGTCSDINELDYCITLISFML